MFFDLKEQRDERSVKSFWNYVSSRIFVPSLSRARGARTSRPRPRFYYSLAILLARGSSRIRFRARRRPRDSRRRRGNESSERNTSRATLVARERPSSRATLFHPDVISLRIFFFRERTIRCHSQYFLRTRSTYPS